MIMHCLAVTSPGVTYLRQLRKYDKKRQGTRIRRTRFSPRPVPDSAVTAQIPERTTVSNVLAGGFRELP